ncbi:MAG TPA: hypothetical protein VKV21_10465 [Solirubrobacteraceae bacterium]|nr:hypothetical protein [Solirubrobacteraceae bacterium]
MGPERNRHATSGRPSALVAVLALLLVAPLLAGCATVSSLPGHTRGGARLVGQDGPPADPAKLAVVRRWAAELRAGDLRGAAGFFHLPSLFEDGAGATLTIHTRAQAEAANATLTCGAIVISAFRTGSFIDVLFRLTARAGRGGGRRACGPGIGRTARTEFLIRAGQIVAWVRAPSLPGDPGVPGTPPRSGGGGSPGGGGGSGGGLPA